MKARDFFTAMPKLCGCQDAEREADIIGYIYDRELEGGSVWDRNDADKENISHRSDMAFRFEAMDEGAKTQCQRLALILELSHYQKEHGEDRQKTIDALWADAVEAESTYPEPALCERLISLTNRPEQFVAKIRLTEESGLILNTGKRTHYSWWRAKDFDPIAATVLAEDSV